MAGYVDRIIRAAELDSNLYEEVEADAGAFWQAFGVVALSGMATVVGLTGRVQPSELISGLVLGILGWSAWSAIAYLIGARLFPETQTRSDWGELLRTTGFATAPGMLSIVGIIPACTGFITMVASVWILLAFAVAVRQALDYRSTGRAIVVCMIGWLLYAGMLLEIMPRASAAILPGGGPRSGWPSIVKLAPDHGGPGDPITAYGTSLDTASVDSLYLTHRNVTALVNISAQSETSIRFKIPILLEAGRYRVLVRYGGRYARDLPQPVTLTVDPSHTSSLR